MKNNAKGIYVILRTAVMLIALIALLTGCGGSTDIDYPEGVETYTFTDDYGREVELRKDISRIVASGPNAQMVLVTLAPEMMVGLAEAPSRAQQPYFPAAVCLFCRPYQSAGYLRKH